MTKRYTDEQIEEVMDQIYQAQKAYNARQARNTFIVILAMIIGISVGIAIAIAVPGTLL